MEDLVKKVAAEAGISEAQARAAVVCTGNYIKSRMPGFLQSQIDPILNGKTWDESLKEQAQGLGDEVRNRADSLATDLRDAFDRAFGKKNQG